MVLLELQEHCGQCGKRRNHVTVGHPGERGVNPEAGKLTINMDIKAKHPDSPWSESCRSVIMIKSYKPRMQITTSKETTPNQFVFPDALNTCLE